MFLRLIKQSNFLPYVKKISPLLNSARPRNSITYLSTILACQPCHMPIKRPLHWHTSSTKLGQNTKSLHTSSGKNNSLHRY